MYGPDTVTLQPPEGLLWVVGLPLRSEFLQQLRQFRFRLLKSDSLESLLPPAERVEDE